MSRQAVFYHWKDQVVKHFVNSGVLSKPQAFVLAAVSCGIALAGRCALPAVAKKLPFLGGENTVLQRLKYWLRNGREKRTPGEPEVDVRLTFRPLIRWILSIFHSLHLPLAIDATTLRDDLAVLAVCLLYRGTAIPLAWACLKANRKKAWMPIILDLLQRISEAIPRSHYVLVLTDRGLYSPRLYKRIKRYGWHPLMRINGQGQFKPRYRPARPIKSFLPGPGYQWRGRGRAFKNHPIRCTLVAVWLEGQEEPWFLITDLGPCRVQAAWYGLRMWVEEGFRVLKSIGWQWQKSRITKPQRAERLWLALALASTWILAYGTWAEDQREGPPPEVRLLAETAPTVTRDPEAPPGDPGLERVSHHEPNTRVRHQSIIRQGLAELERRLGTRLRYLKILKLVPEPWPKVVKNG